MQRTNRFTTSTTTTTTTTTTTPTNTNRRSYGGRNSNSGNNNSNNSNNSFKFHNFIFNEDNQSFCLEEQHGNKKITVLHWKKGSGTGGGDDQSNCGLSKTSSDGVVANVSKRRNVDVKTSGSFPLPSGQGQLIMPTLSIISTTTTTTGTTSQSPLIQSSNALRHTSSGPSNINEMLNPYNETNRSKSSSQIEHLIRSNASSSSITTSSSSSSTSQVANWLNQSLNDLDLSNVYQQPKQQQHQQQQMKSGKLGSSNRRRFMDDSDSDDEEGEIEDLNESDTSNDPFEQYRQLVKQIAERVTKLDNDTNMMIQTQPLDLSTKSPSSSSSNVTRDHNNNNNQWTIDSILNERTNRIDDEECSMNSFVSDSKSKQRNHHHHLQVPCSSQSNQWFQWDSSRIRSETTSPSALISAINCRSPTSQSNSSVNVSNPVIVNPFLFAGLNPNTTSTNTNTNTTTSVINRSFDDDEELFGRRRTRIQRQTQPQQPPPPESSSRSKPHHYMFDTFLEEEISKILQSNSKSTIGGRNDSINHHHHHHHHHHPHQHLFHHRHHFHDQENENDIDEEEDNDDEDDIEKRIENKLRSLHREVLNNRSREMFEQNLFQSSSGSQQDHLRLHFKLDSNKNLEPFNGREQQQQQQQKRNRSEPCLKQMLLLNNRQRRTQIKRQLEDTFACNSLVKMCNQSSIGRQSRSTNDILVFLGCGKWLMVGNHSTNSALPNNKIINETFVGSFTSSVSVLLLVGSYSRIETYLD
ncbi:hypothetical protein BLOT_014790 [Blomia tropicalis]|nr:hypothetical protein BLOT_014790 [Blomia tropicalis]